MNINLKCPLSSFVQSTPCHNTHPILHITNPCASHQTFFIVVPSTTGWRRRKNYLIFSILVQLKLIFTKNIFSSHLRAIAIDFVPVFGKPAQIIFILFALALPRNTLELLDGHLPTQIWLVNFWEDKHSNSSSSNLESECHCMYDTPYLNEDQVQFIKFSWFEQWFWVGMYALIHYLLSKTLKKVQQADDTICHNNTILKL